jgi:hypothetical protein
MARGNGSYRRCPHDGKHTYTRKVAESIIHRRRHEDDGDLYWCPAAGGYHVTRLPKAEYDRRRQAYRPPTEERDGQNEQI